MNHSASPRHGLARADVLFTLVTILLLIAVGLPALGAGRLHSAVSRSHVNLSVLGMGNAIYAADWNGRQPTFIQDDMSTYGDSVASAFSNYNNQQGGPFDAHPPITLGWGVLPNDPVPHTFAYHTYGNNANAALTVPISFESVVNGFGAFRLPNTRQFRQYISSGFYDPTFYPPSDEVVYPIVEEFFDDPWEFTYTPPVPGFGDAPVWSSYIYSPAAMFHPDVMRSAQAGGFQDPWSIDHGMESQGFYSARFPNLKTLMIEHHWLQNTPANPCNPAFDPGQYNGCEPYYFNHGMDSSPVTLFYDLSVRQLPNSEVKAADDLLIEKTGYGLWSRDTPWGNDGYFNALSYDEVDLSHHILTTDGILGRDTISK